MPRWVKVIYAVTLVAPIAYQAVRHAYLFVIDTIAEVKEKWQEALRGP